MDIIKIIRNNNIVIDNIKLFIRNEIIYNK